MKKLFTVNYSLLTILFTVNCCSLLTINCAAQRQRQIKIDSLLSSLTNNKTDTVLINNWVAISTEYANGNPDSGIYFGNLALSKSKEVKWIQGEIRSLLAIGGSYSRKGMYDKALNVFDQSINLSKESGDSLHLANGLYGIANIYMDLGDYNKSTNYINTALLINQLRKDKFRVGDDYNLLGIIALNQKQYNEALRQYDKALQAAIESNNKTIVAYAYSNSGIAYAQLNQYSKALELQFKALAIEEEMGDVYGIATEYGSISDDYMGLYREQKNRENTSLIDSAIKYSELGIELCRKCDDPLDRSTMTLALSEIYKTKKDYKKALELYAEGSALEDSVFSSDRQKQIREEESKQQAMLHEKEIKIQELEIKRQKLFRNFSLAGIAGLILFAFIVVRQRNKVKKEKARSEELLLNILPAETAEELKNTGTTKAKDFNIVTVMFTDFKNFTAMSEKLSAQELVNEINYCYSAFDNIITKHGIEKIKTIGDSYMCAGGLPVANNTNAEETVRAAIEIRDFMLKEKQKRESEGKQFFEIRIGCNTGAVVAGIVGIKKYSYDIWGDTVNIASRMESSGEPGRVNISGSTYELVKEKFSCTHRGKIEAKNKGMVDMYFVET